MSSNRHSVVIVGFGGMGSYHAGLIKETSTLIVVGTYDVLEARRTNSNDAGYKAYQSYEEVLADSSVEIILIATPNDVHKEIAIRALQAGKHVICEKPVALSKVEFQEILAAADQAGRVFMVHQNRRWDEDFLTIKKCTTRRRLDPYSRSNPACTERTEFLVTGVMLRHKAEGCCWIGAFTYWTSYYS